MFGLDARCLEIMLEGLDAFIAQRLGMPLALVLGEQGEGLGADGLGIEWGVLDTTGGGYMGTDVLV